MSEARGSGPEAGPLLTPTELAAAGRAVTAPFRIALRIAAPPGNATVAAPDLPPGAEVVAECVEILRLLPGRRLTARAQVAGRPVLLKLFLGRGATRYVARESRGSALLARAGVPSAALLARATAGADAAPVLLFEWLDAARPLDPADGADLAAAAALLARLHASGCVHLDPHADNVLRAGADGATLRLVDADAVRAAPFGRLRSDGLDARQSARNLALLCAQLPPGGDSALAAIHAAYLVARGWPTAPAAASLARLRAVVAAARRRRVARYLRKTLRDCTEFAVTRDAQGFRAVVRERETPALRRVLADPEAALRAGTMLKDGNSATVVRVAADGTTWVLKRYNVKGARHAFRRSLRPVPRWRNAWRNGQRLHFLGVATARPVALLERRRGPFRGVAYLVMEDLGDRDLQAASEAGAVDADVVCAVAELFGALAVLGLEHGDTKATNFLLQGDRIALVDLDGMRARGRGAARAAARDRARFLANWADRPALRERFAAALERLAELAS